MLYQIGKDAKEIAASEIRPGSTVIGLITYEELLRDNKYYGFLPASLTECGEDNDCFRSTIDQYEDYSFGVLNIIDLGNILGDRDRVGFFVKKDLLLFVDIIDEDKSSWDLISDTIQKLRGQEMNMGKTAYTVFERFIHGDTKSLEAIEFKIDELDEKFVAGQFSASFNHRLLRMKKEVLILRNYYEQLVDIGETLQENANDLFEDDELKYFQMFATRCTRLSGDTQQLRESLVQLREAYQASLDYNVNNVMKLFTVVTTIFLPLTLITSWYGMNFRYMPELSWKYSYLGVVALCVIVIIACLLYFKKKKLL